MAEDDLFLDDEAEETPPAPKPKPKTKGKGSAKKASTSAKAEAAKPDYKPAAKKTGEVPPPKPTDDSQSISLWAASILVICAFVIGFAAGGIVFSGGSQQVPTAPQEITNQGGLPGNGTQAPPLTQQQQQGGLPKGHPKLPAKSGEPTKSGGSK